MCDVIEVEWPPACQAGGSQSRDTESNGVIWWRDGSRPGPHHSSRGRCARAPWRGDCRGWPSTQAKGQAEALGQAARGEAERLNQEPRITHGGRVILPTGQKGIYTNSLKSYPGFKRKPASGPGHGRRWSAQARQDRSLPQAWRRPSRRHVCRPPPSAFRSPR
jgi:hypothetical protein